MRKQTTIQIKALNDFGNREDFILALLEQKTIVQGTVIDKEEFNAAYKQFADRGAHPCLVPFAFMIVSLVPTALPHFTSFITTYMTTRSNEKIVFEAEKKGKKVHIEIPAGLNEEQIQEKLTPLKELFESL